MGVRFPRQLTRRRRLPVIRSAFSHAVPMPWHGRPASASIVLPPMSVLWLTPERD